MEVYYLEYRIKVNRPGLLGDISSMLGMLGINIITVNGISNQYRGFLIQGSTKRLQMLDEIFQEVDSVEVTALRHPKLLDVISLKHGIKINSSGKKPQVFTFTRSQLGIMVDLLGELIKEKGNKIIGLRGMPRVGKSEAAIASCVYANKKWVLLSSTIIRQNLRTYLTDEEKNEENCVFLIDAITTISRGSLEHKQLIDNCLKLAVPKIIEHPDILVRDGEFSFEQFDYIFELKQTEDEEINYESINTTINTFDLS